MITDPRLPFQNNIEQSSRFYSGLILAVYTALATFYLKFGHKIPEVINFIMALGSFMNALIALTWQRKIQIWIQQKEAIVELYKGADNRMYKYYFEFEEAFLGSKKEALKFKYHPSTNFYDEQLPRLFKMISIGLALLFTFFFLINVFTS